MYEVDMLFNTNIVHDEHVAGYLFRTHIVSGHRRYSATAKAFNVDENKLLKSNQFSNSSLIYGLADSGIDSSKNLLLNHTPSLLWKFEPSAKDENLDFLFGIEANERRLIGFPRSWHFCHDCIDDDIILNGFSYWHNILQLPSLTHCPYHNKPLSTCTTQLRDLRTACLPQSYSDLPRSYKDTSSLISWSEFLIKAYKYCQNNDVDIYNIHNQIKQHIGIKIEQKVKLKDFNNYCNQAWNSFKEDMDHSLLVHLFKPFSTNTTQEVNVIRSTLSNKFVSGYRSPVYLLAIMYWLQHHHGHVFF
jgi:hypothetical protein